LIGTPIIIGGIPLPSDTPLFLTLIALHIAAGLTCVVAQLGIHMTGMGASYVLLITAFYVDNGPNLPLWRELPQIAFWILPSLVGAPILLNSFFRHPLVRFVSARDAG
jgi:hypothetical protein